jgi:hypothetical protein
MAPKAYLPPKLNGGERQPVQVVTERLASSLASLRCLSPLQISGLLGEVHADWAAPKSCRRHQAVDLLATITGYACATLDRSLSRLFGALTESALRDWLKISAPVAQSLIGPPVIGVVAAGNLPGTAIPSLVQALLLRSACLVKSAAAEPYLMPLYAQSLAERSSEIAEAIAVSSWTRDDETSTDALLHTADALIVYGSDPAIRALRDRFPQERPVIGYGHRISLSVIGRGALTRRRVGHTARKAALDLAVFDQQGCLSPQALYIQRGGEVSPSAFAELLSQGLERLRTLLPRRPLSAEEAGAIHQFRAEFELGALPRRGARLWQSEGGTAWTVALEPELALRPCPLNRTAVLHPFDGLEDIATGAAACRGHLISCGTAVSTRQEAWLRSALGELGVSRFCRLGRAQFPTAEEILLHDGVNALKRLGSID